MNELLLQMQKTQIEILQQLQTKNIQAALTSSQAPQPAPPPLNFDPVDDIPDDVLSDALESLTVSCLRRALF